MLLVDKILRAGEGKARRRLEALVAAINAIEPDFVAMTDEQLRAMTDELRGRLTDGEHLDDLLPEAFATVREAAHRVLGQRPYDVQLMGGAALHTGAIAEMKTGEGKTLVAALPSYLNALTGKGVHVVTVNDYLAKYQAEQMGRVHHFLGLTTGVISPGMTPPERRAAYACDITYSTNNELGFDYLRDNMAARAAHCVQRGHHFAIVDEVDSILIDEARTPLIISGPVTSEMNWHTEFARIIALMSAGEHYTVDEKKRTVSVTAAGITFVEDQVGITNLYEAANTPLIAYMNNAIKARELFRRDKEYVVRDGEVLIVDEHTGRLLAGRRFNDGLHQAIEAREGVEVRDEYQTLASVTLQNYFRGYDKLAGMTGTASTEAGEFNKTYNLDVIEIPTHRPVARVDAADVVYRSEDAKFNAVIADIKTRNATGQPVLVGTVSVAKSEHLSKLLTAAGIPHTVLNAKQHADEAKVVALAGHKGAVTVATNMAGRGTDIMLGGSVDFLADAELRAQGLDPVEDTEAYDAAWPAVVDKIQAQVAADRDEVKALGGLYVIGTERHESRRIDNQLRGRSGRQGDPGESRFYLSLEDDLMRLFKGDMVQRVLSVLNVPADMPIENKRVTGAIANAQAQVEAKNFESRKNVLKYDDVLDRQRQVIYAERRAVLEGKDLSAQVRSFIVDVIDAHVAAACTGYAEDWDLDALFTTLAEMYPTTLSAETVENAAGGRAGLIASVLSDDVARDALTAYYMREVELTEPILREVERQVLLAVLDRKWREHLYEMDYLREGINLRAYAQRDPLVEYQREGHDAFVQLMSAIKEETARLVFNARVTVTDPNAPAPEQADAEQADPQTDPQTDQTADQTAGELDGDVVDQVAEAASEASAETPPEGAGTAGVVVADEAVLTAPVDDDELTYTAPEEPDGETKA